MGYLLDTNIVSELRKGRRCDARVAAWHDQVESDSLWLSVVVIAEIRQGVEQLRRKDPATAGHLEKWLDGLEKGYAERILTIDLAIAHRWGILNGRNPLPYIDGFLAATALEHGLTVATRNVGDIQSTGVGYVNPFAF